MHGQQNVIKNYHNWTRFFIFSANYSGTCAYPVIVLRCSITDDLIFISVRTVYTKKKGANIVFVRGIVARCVD